MKRLVNILMVTLLLMACGALALGILLFRKRELLIGRTREMERALIGLAATIERPIAPLERTPAYPARDLDRVDAPLTRAPRRSEFWTAYPHALELAATDTIDLRAELVTLRTYYQIDPASGRVAKDPLTRARVIDGPDTMRTLLTKLIAQASDQLGRLQATRSTLTETRDELVSSVTELNGLKGNLRLANQTIDDQNGTLTELRADIARQAKSIEAGEEMIATLESDVERVAADLKYQQQTLVTASNEMAVLRHQLASYRDSIRSQGETDWPGLTRGSKGSVSAVDPEWGFVVLNVSDAFIREYQEAWLRAHEEPSPELLVYRRSGEEREFVTKVRVARVHVDEGIAVAGVLRDWQQTPIQAGDGVVY